MQKICLDLHKLLKDIVVYLFYESHTYYYLKLGMGLRVLLATSQLFIDKVFGNISNQQRYSHHG